MAPLIPPAGAASAAFPVTLRVWSVREIASDLTGTESDGKAEEYDGCRLLYCNSRIQAVTERSGRSVCTCACPNWGQRGVRHTLISTTGQQCVSVRQLQGGGAKRDEPLRPTQKVVRVPIGKTGPCYFWFFFLFLSAKPERRALCAFCI